MYKHKKWSFLAVALVSLFVVARFEPSVMAAGSLVGYWNFDETSGTTAADASGFTNNGTLLNGAVSSPTVPPISCFNDPRSISFNGSGAYVNVPDSPSMDPATQISIGFWMKPDALSGNYEHLVFKQGPSLTSYGVWIDPNAKLYLETNDNNINGLSGATTIAPGAWHYVTATYDGITQKIYLDGILDNATPLSNVTISYDSGQPLKIGAGDFNDPFAGYIDDLRIYDRALTQAEITDLSSGGCGPNVVAQSTPTTTAGTPTVASPGIAPAAAALVNTGSKVAVISALASSLVVASIAVKRSGRGRSSGCRS